MYSKLYRSRTDKMIGGVCGGLADYLRIDATVVRLFFLLLGLTTGVGLTLYLVLWIIMPYQGEGAFARGDTIRTGSAEVTRRGLSMANDVREAVRQPDPKAGVLIGAALIIWGWIALLRNLNIPWLSWLRFDLLWPALLIVAGVVLLLRLLQDNYG